MWFVWNRKNCWATRWSAVWALKWVPYWCDLDRKNLALKECCWLSLDGVALLVLFLVFGLVLFLTCGVADDGLGVLTSFCALWGGVDCDTGTLWDGAGGETGGAGTLLAFTGRDICGIVGVVVTNGKTIKDFLWLFRVVLLFFKVHFWFYHHIPVMVQLIVCFEGWQECLFLDDWDNPLVWPMGKESR